MYLYSHICICICVLCLEGWDFSNCGHMSSFVRSPALERAGNLFPIVFLNIFLPKFSTFFAPPCHLFVTSKHFLNNFYIRDACYRYLKYLICGRIYREFVYHFYMSAFSPFSKLYLGILTDKQARLTFPLARLCFNVGLYFYNLPYQSHY